MFYTEVLYTSLDSSKIKMTRKLSAHDKGLMGTANQLFAQNKVDDAIKIAMEVIRNCPGSPEPYQLLKAIVEDNGYVGGL